MSDDVIRYGTWLRRERKARGISQERLSELAQVDRGYLSRIENLKVGVPEPPLRNRVHAALGTTEDQLRELGIIRDVTIHVPTATATATAHNPAVERRDAEGRVITGTATAQGGTHTATVDAEGRVVPSATHPPAPLSEFDPITDATLQELAAAIRQVSEGVGRGLLANALAFINWQKNRVVGEGRREDDAAADELAQLFGQPVEKTSDRDIVARNAGVISV